MDPTGHGYRTIGSVIRGAMRGFLLTGHDVETLSMHTSACCLHIIYMFHLRSSETAVF